MIEAAIDTGDAKTMRAVVQIARTTRPGDSSEIDTLEALFQARLEAESAAQKAAQEHRIRTAKVYENWRGKGQVGAFRSSGNSNDAGVSLGLDIERQGITWRHRLRAALDYQRSNGLTSREQYLL